MDRRDYPRFKVNVKGVMFTNGTEVNFEIVNLSEHGLLLTIDSKQDHLIKVRSSVVLQFTDTFILGYKETKEVIICQFTVIHKRTRRNTTYLGCHTYNNAFSEYVGRRRFSDYFSRMLVQCT